MKKFKHEELLGIVPNNLRKSKELTKKQQLVLGQLLIYNELEQTKNNGYFYRSNRDLCNDIDIGEPTLISALIKLEQMGFIERQRGKRGGKASEYMVFTDAIESFNTKKQNFSNQDETKILEMADRIRVLEDLVRELSARIERIESTNFSTDTETVNTDTETDTDLQYKNLYTKELITSNNILNNNIINNNNILKEKNNIKEKEKKQTELNSKNLKEKGTDTDSTDLKEDVGSTWMKNNILDPTDFDDDEETDFFNDLNKRIAYAKWDNEEYETA